jgi:cysteine desulfurase / selenocysteine lyase
MDESPVRSLFPIVDECVFLDHARVAPISTRVEQAIVRFAGEATRELRLRYPYWNERAEDVRRACARLVGATADQVAFVKNTSEALSFVAEGLDWRAGDVVLGADREFPSNVYPWLGLARLGVETRLLDPGPAGVTVDDVARALDARVRVVALSAVAYGAGERLDLAGIAQLCRERDALFVVDGIQAVGAIDLDLARDGMDCIAADGHKWLCAPEGGGFMAVSDRLLGRLRPVQLGWKSVTTADYHPYDFSLRREAAKLEAGSLNLLAVHALGAAVDLALEVGIATIEARLAALTSLLEDGFASRGCAVLGRDPDGRRARRAGIVNFVPARPAERVRQDLWERGVASTVRFGGIRLSPHHYQDDRDVAAFFTRLDDAEAAAG